MARQRKVEKRKANACETSLSEVIARAGDPQEKKIGLPFVLKRWKLQYKERRNELKKNEPTNKQKRMGFFLNAKDA